MTGVDAKPFGPVFNTGDIVRIRVDVGQQVLQYAISNEKEDFVGKFNKSVTIATSNTPYYLTVSNGEVGDKVVIVNYSCSGAENDETKDSDEVVFALFALSVTS